MTTKYEEKADKSLVYKSQCNAVKNKNRILRNNLPLCSLMPKWYTSRIHFWLRSNGRGTTCITLYFYTENTKYNSVLCKQGSCYVSVTVVRYTSDNSFFKLPSF